MSSARYTPEFKDEAVRQVVDRGHSVGVEWEATAKTSGLIRIGELDKEFDSSARTDDDLNIWEVGLTWSPRTYSHFILNASKEPQESNGTGSFIESQNTTLTWMHSWSEQMTSMVTIGDGEDEYSQSLREDDRQSIAVSVSYDLRRWATLSANYSYTERESNNPLFDFEKNVVTVSVDMSL